MRRVVAPSLRLANPSTFQRKGTDSSKLMPSGAFHCKNLQRNCKPFEILRPQFYRIHKILRNLHIRAIRTNIDIDDR